MFEHEGHGIPGIEMNHDLAHAFRDAGVNAVIFHYRGSCGWAALTVGADERVKAVVTISAVVNPPPGIVLAEGNGRPLRPWLIERVVSWVERLASSHPGAPGRDG